MPWGDILRNAREQLGYSLDMIEEETKIRKYYLEALENDDFSSLPPKIYAIGFLKKYARLLHLDEQEIVEEFKQLAYGNEIQEEHVVIHTERVNQEKNLPWRNIIFGIIFLIFVLWLSNYLAPFVADQGIKNSVTEKGEKQGTDNPAERKDQESKAGAIKIEAKLEIKATQKCWLQVLVDGQQQYAGTLAPGQDRTFTGKQSVYIKAGNAGGVELTYNGQQQPPLGAIGEVIEKEFIAEKQGSGQE